MNTDLTTAIIDVVKQLNRALPVLDDVAQDARNRAETFPREDIRRIADAYTEQSHDAHEALRKLDEANLVPNIPDLEAGEIDGRTCDSAPEQLLPCPFCGKAPHTASNVITIFARCEPCGIKWRTADSWNTRRFFLRHIPESCMAVPGQIEELQ